MEAEAFVSAIREQRLRAELSIPKELSEDLDCEQMNLESAFMEAKPEVTMVSVHRVELAQSDLKEGLSSVVKYSPARLASARSEHLKIATARHYREFKGGGPGVRDERDAVYQQTLRSFLERRNPDAIPLLSPLSTTVTAESQDYTVEVVPGGTVNRSADGQWIYCTSLEPRTNDERTQMFEEFDADCMTRFQGPTELARELGSAFSQISSELPVTLDSVFEQCQISAMKNRSPFDRIVHVFHGPVAYTDDPERLIEPIPTRLQASAVPFLKSPDFAHQREYRFTISTIGTPAKDVLLVPVTAELKALIGGTELRTGSVGEE